MIVKKRARGGQPGNQNAVKHGRHSVPVRAARLAAFAEQQRRSAEWMKTIPQTDYGAIVDNLRALKAAKRGGDKQMTLSQQILPTFGSFESSIPHAGRGVQFCSESSRESGNFYPGGLS